MPRHRMLPGRNALAATAILLVAFGLRVAEVQRTTYRPIYDGGAYMALASQIAHHGDYSSGDRGAAGSRGPTAYFPPGYPYFLAAVDLIDGHEGPRGASVHAALLAQALLGAVIVGLIGLIALELFGSAVALVAMAVAAAYPVMIELCGTLVAENLLTALVLGAVLAVLRARRARRPYAWIACAGVLTGLATLTHEDGIVLLIPLGWALWRRRAGSSLSAAAAPALLVIVAVLTLAPWTLRNALVLHRFIPVADETGITLVGTYNPTSAADRAIPYKWRFYASLPQEGAIARETGRLTETELDSRLMSRAFDYLGGHPLAPFAAAYHNTLRLFELEGSFAWRSSAAAIGLNAGTAHVGVVAFWIVCVLALIGLGNRRLRSAPRWLWLVPLLLAVAVVLVNADTPRFREPIDPFLILVAACGLTSLATRAGRRFTRSRTSGGAPVCGEGRATVPAAGAEAVEVGERLT